MRRMHVFTALLFLLSACSLPGREAASGDVPRPAGASDAHRIAIRSVDGNAEFYDTLTSEKFTPRGANYVDFKELVPGELWEDYIFGAGTHKPETVRAAFQQLAQRGYNTVRMFFDHCGKGPSCIGAPTGDGLNPVFLDHMVEVMWMAEAEGLHLLLTANGVPLQGRYWERWDPIFQADMHGFDSFFENGYYLHKAGVDMQVQYWQDLMSGLAERSAPFEVVLGWELQNEYFLTKERGPLSWTSGSVTVANGQSYDMGDALQKRQMVTDQVLYWMNALIPVIREHDPEALVTTGFFAPDFPNPPGLADSWYRDTASLIHIAPVDFWDFHHYPFVQDIRTTMRNGAENFGMIDFTAKPVIMGEYGVFREVESDISRVALSLQRWMAASCEYGFDGWLVWEYKDRPAGDQVWGMESAGGALLDALAPATYPDPCTIVPVPDGNLARDKLATASSFVPENPPSLAVDDTANHWLASGFPPQWIEIDLGGPTTVSEINLRAWQDVVGTTHHILKVRTADGAWQTVQEFTGETHDTQTLYFTPETPLQAIRFVRVETVQGPAWVGWHEIRILGTQP